MIAPKSAKVDPVVLKQLSFEQRTPLETEQGTKRKDFTTFDPVAPLKKTSECGQVQGFRKNDQFDAISYDENVT